MSGSCWGLVVLRDGVAGTVLGGEGVGGSLIGVCRVCEAERVVPDGRHEGGLGPKAKAGGAVQDELGDGAGPGAVGCTDQSPIGGVRALATQSVTEGAPRVRGERGLRKAGIRDASRQNGKAQQGPLTKLYLSCRAYAKLARNVFLGVFR